MCKAVKVKNDLTCAATYRGHGVPNDCALLHKSSSLMNTGNMSIIICCVIFISKLFNTKFPP